MVQAYGPTGPTYGPDVGAGRVGRGAPGVDRVHRAVAAWSRCQYFTKCRAGGQKKEGHACYTTVASVTYPFAEVETYFGLEG